MTIKESAEGIRASFLGKMRVEPEVLSRILMGRDGRTVLPVTLCYPNQMAGWDGQALYVDPWRPCQSLAVEGAG